MRRGLLLGALVSALVTTAGWGVAASAVPTEPTGRLVVLSEGKSTAFSTMAPDGSDRQKILTLDPEQSWRIGPIDVTQDGSTIAASLSPTYERHLYTLASDGSNFEVRASDGFFVAPAFAPSGSDIAASWHFEGQNYLVAMATDAPDQPYPSDALTVSGEPRPAAGRGIAWSPDGQWIAFIAHTADWDTVVLTDPAGESFRFPVAFWHRQNGGTIRSVGWSPDSSQLVFAAYDRRGEQTDLWTVDVDGSDLQQVTDTARRIETSPDFSPDGTAIAFVVTNLRGGWSDVAVMAVDGSSRSRIETVGPDERQVAWGG